MMKIKDWARLVFYPFLLNRGKWLMNRVPPGKVSVLMYHTIAPEPPEYTIGAYPVKTPQQFELDLQLLTRFAFAADIHHLTHSNSMEDPGFIITFDDGLSGCYHYAYPLLKKYGLTGIFFVNPEFIENRGLFYRYKANILLNRLLLRTSAQQKDILKKINKRKIPVLNHPGNLAKWLQNAKYSDTGILNELAVLLDWDEKAYLAEEQPFMTRNMLIEMQANGMIIGAHSMTHPLYSELGFSEQLAETEQSLEFVKNLPGNQDLLFAYPFTADGADPSLYASIQNRLRPEAMFGTGGAGSTGPLHQRISADHPARNILKEIAFSWLYLNLRQQLKP